MNDQRIHGQADINMFIKKLKVQYNNLYLL